ncbi:MAG: hypothetical protein AB7L66_05225 [Gemmatimonadales bacterium]
MLIIRQAQLDAMGRALDRQFTAAVRSHLAEQFPDRIAALSPEALAAEIEQGCAQGREFGLESEADVAALIHFRFEAGPDFATHPEFGWAVAALMNPDLTSPERVDRLFEEWAARKPAA